MRREREMEERRGEADILGCSFGSKLLHETVLARVEQPRRGERCSEGITIVRLFLVVH